MAWRVSDFGGGDSVIFFGLSIVMQCTCQDMTLVFGNKEWSCAAVRDAVSALPCFFHTHAEFLVVPLLHIHSVTPFSGLLGPESHPGTSLNCSLRLTASTAPALCLAPCLRASPGNCSFGHTARGPLCRMADLCAQAQWAHRSLALSSH